MRAELGDKAQKSRVTVAVCGNKHGIGRARARARVSLHKEILYSDWIGG